MNAILKVNGEIVGKGTVEEMQKMQSRLKAWAEDDGAEIDTEIVECDIVPQ